jgi:hypothetical protein
MWRKLLRRVVPQHVIEKLKEAPAHVITENSENEGNASNVGPLGQVPPHGIQPVNDRLWSVRRNLRVLLQESDGVIGCHGEGGSGLTVWLGQCYWCKDKVEKGAGLLSFRSGSTFGGC